MIQLCRTLFNVHIEVDEVCVTRMMIHKPCNVATVCCINVDNVFICHCIIQNGRNIQINIVVWKTFCLSRSILIISLLHLLCSHDLPKKFENKGSNRQSLICSNVPPFSFFSLENLLRTRSTSIECCPILDYVQVHDSNAK
jgi:hypothetical protein